MPTAETKIFAFFLSAPSIAAFSGCTHRMPGQPMGGGWDHMMGYGAYGGIFMWLILILVAAVIIYFVFNQGKKENNTTKSAKGNSIEILKQRYAKGEITKDEYESMRKDIER